MPQAIDSSRRIRVLAVDDDRTSLLMVSRVLERAGCEVVRATGGREAVDRLRAHPDVAIVITDWNMDDLDGPELVSVIRREFTEPYRFVIMLTARTDGEDAARALECGADEFVSKPVVDSELVARVRTASRLLGIQMRDSLILSLAKLAESRDTDTGEHLMRTQAFCRRLAEELLRRDPSLPADLPALVALCSPLHDIGKVGIPDSVLLKPGRLTDEEFEVMKSHTTIGAATIDTAIEASSASPMLVAARQIVRHHHERWDGTGYPDGLVGEEIPIVAQVMSVADVYDALRSDRVYKPPFDHERACESIVEGAGTQFSPRMVDVFRAVAPRFAEIAREHGLGAPRRAA